MVASRSLPAAAAILFAVAAGVYGIGVYLMGTRLCERIGPEVAILAIAGGVFASGLVAAHAIVSRSTKSWIACIAALLVTAVLYFLIGVMALPGCSGV